MEDLVIFWLIAKTNQKLYYAPMLELQYVLWKKVDAAVAIDKTLGLTETEDVEVLESGWNY